MKARPITVWFSLLIVLTVGLVAANGEAFGKELYQMVTEEEHLASHLPSHMLCDGCRAVAFQVHLALEKRHQFNPDQDFRLSDIDLVDVFDNTCHTRSFEGYGVGLTSTGKSDHSIPINVDSNVLRGPGSRFDGGQVAAGGRMPSRLSELCQVLTTADDEEEDGTLDMIKRLYELWAKGGRVQHVLIEAMCYDHDYCAVTDNLWQ